jgi:hypothetical protein
VPEGVGKIAHLSSQQWLFQLNYENGIISRSARFHKHVIIVVHNERSSGVAEMRRAKRLSGEGRYDVCAVRDASLSIDVLSNSAISP